MKNYIYILIILLVLYIIIENFNKEDMTQMSTNRKFGKLTGFSTTCIDLRFVDEEDTYLEQKIIGTDLYNKYTVPGASLALRRYKDENIDSINNYVDYDFFISWKKALDISIATNNTRKIIIIDHEDCDYYKKYYNKKNSFNQDYITSSVTDRFNIHQENMNKTINQIKLYLENKCINDPEIALKNLNSLSTYNNMEIEGHIIKMDGQGYKITGPLKINRSNTVNALTLCKSPSISPRISPSIQPSISPRISPRIAPSISPSITPSIPPSIPIVLQKETINNILSYITKIETLLNKIPKQTPTYMFYKDYMGDETNQIYNQFFLLIDLLKNTNELFFNPTFLEKYSISTIYNEDMTKNKYENSFSKYILFLDRYNYDVLVLWQSLLSQTRQNVITWQTRTARFDPVFNNLSDELKILFPFLKEILKIT